MPLDWIQWLTVSDASGRERRERNATRANNLGESCVRQTDLP
jgi:hypothetical protein